MDRMFEQSMKASVLKGSRISSPLNNEFQSSDLTWVGWSWIVLPALFLMLLILALRDL